jgi:hypothetical protein
MSSIARFRPKPVCVLVAITFTSCLALAQTSPAPPAPVPPQIMVAKKVFIANAGFDAPSLAAFKKAGEPDQPYNEFYSAVKNWGRYELVSSPADADVVFQIRFAAPLFGCQNLDTYAPQLEVTVLDAKTHFVLWSVSAPVDGAYRKETWDKNFAQGITSIMNDLKKLASPPVAPASATQK